MMQTHPQHQTSTPIRVLRTALNAALSVVLVVAVLVGIVAIVIPAVTGSQALTVQTSSMQPSLPAGTMVVVRPTAARDIVPGDVLTYQLRSGDPTLVTHRVNQRMQLADGSFTFETQGDSNNTPDSPVVKEVQVRGTVWYSIPYLGWFSSHVTSGTRTYVPFIALGLLGYAALMVGLAVRDKRRAQPGTAP